MFRISTVSLARLGLLTLAGICFYFFVLLVQEGHAVVCSSARAGLDCHSGTSADLLFQEIFFLGVSVLFIVIAFRGKTSGTRPESEKHLTKDNEAHNPLGGASSKPAVGYLCQPRNASRQHDTD